MSSSLRNDTYLVYFLSLSSFYISSNFFFHLTLQCECNAAIVLWHTDIIQISPITVYKEAQKQFKIEAYMCVFINIDCRKSLCISCHRHKLKKARAHTHTHIHLYFCFEEKKKKCCTNEFSIRFYWIIRQQKAKLIHQLEHRSNSSNVCFAMLFFFSINRTLKDNLLL